MEIHVLKQMTFVLSHFDLSGMATKDNLNKEQDQEPEKS
jgi:hypothetical protein